MTILITGGAGYIGSHTARLLTELGRDVVVLDTLERGYRDALNDIDLVVGDIADQRTVGKVCRKYRVESVIHFAAYKAVGESMTEPLRYYQNNVAASISRCMNSIISREHMLAARALKASMARHERVRDLIPLGATYWVRLAEEWLAQARD